jgi:hypothetical protein
MWPEDTTARREAPRPSGGSESQLPAVRSVWPDVVRPLHEFVVQIDPFPICVVQTANKSGQGNYFVIVS